MILTAEIPCDTRVCSEKSPRNGDPRSWCTQAQNKFPIARRREWLFVTCLSSDVGQGPHTMTRIWARLEGGTKTASTAERKDFSTKPVHCASLRSVLCKVLVSNCKRCSSNQGRSWGHWCSRFALPTCSFRFSLCLTCFHYPSQEEIHSCARHSPSHMHALANKEQHAEVGDSVKAASLHLLQFVALRATLTQD